MAKATKKVPPKPKARKEVPAKVKSSAKKSAPPVERVAPPAPAKPPTASTPLDKGSFSSPYGDLEYEFHPSGVLTIWSDPPRAISELCLLIEFSEPPTVLGQFLGEDPRGSTMKSWHGSDTTLWTGVHSYEIGRLSKDRPYRLEVEPQGGLRLFPPVWLSRSDLSA